MFNAKIVALIVSTSFLCTTTLCAYPGSENTLRLHIGAGAQDKNGTKDDTFLRMQEIMNSAHGEDGLPTTQGIIELIQEALEKYPRKPVYLYGSAAAGKHDYSDIDILADYDFILYYLAKYFREKTNLPFSPASLEGLLGTQHTLKGAVDFMFDRHKVVYRITRTEVKKFTDKETFLEDFYNEYAVIEADYFSFWGSPPAVFEVLSSYSTPLTKQEIATRLNRAVKTIEPDLYFLRDCGLLDIGKRGRLNTYAIKPGLLQNTSLIASIQQKLEEEFKVVAEGFRNKETIIREISSEIRLVRVASEGGGLAEAKQELIPGTKSTGLDPGSYDPKSIVLPEQTSGKTKGGRNWGAVERILLASAHERKVIQRIRYQSGHLDWTLEAISIMSVDRFAFDTRAEVLSKVEREYADDEVLQGYAEVPVGARRAIIMERRSDGRYNLIDGRTHLYAYAWDMFKRRGPTTVLAWVGALRDSGDSGGGDTKQSDEAVSPQAKEAEGLDEGGSAIDPEAIKIESVWLQGQLGREKASSLTGEVDLAKEDEWLVIDELTKTVFLEAINCLTERQRRMLLQNRRFQVLLLFLWTAASDKAGQTSYKGHLEDSSYLGKIGYLSYGLNRDENNTVKRILGNSRMCQILGVQEFSYG